MIEDAVIIDKNKIKYLQKEIDNSMLNRERWSDKEISRRENLRMQLACAIQGKHYGQHR